MKTKQTFHDYHPESLIVMSGGELDDAYYDAIYAEKRREALRQVKTEAVNHLQQVPARIGHGVLNVLSHIAEQAN
jgi:hypothetical protein